MSPERKEPNNTWQGPNARQWEEPDDVPSYGEDDNEDDQDYEDEDEDDQDYEAEDDQDYEDEEDEQQSTPHAQSSRFAFLARLGQQLSPVLAPLLFGGLTLLFILPFMLTSHSYVPAARLLSVGFVLLALAILHGMALYYAGADNGFWAMAMRSEPELDAETSNAFWAMALVGGFLLFLLVGCFVLFGPLPTLILLVVFLVASILIIRRYKRVVPRGTVEIIESFGQYKRTLKPGLNFIWPWEKVYTQLNTREIEWTCPEQKVRMSRNEDALLSATISYQLDPSDADTVAFEINNWEGSLHELFQAMLQSVAHELSPEDFIVWPQRDAASHHFNANDEPEEFSHWERINSTLFQRMRDRVALWGVNINWVQVRDITLIPHIPTNLLNQNSTSSADKGAEANSKPPVHASATTRQEGTNPSMRAQSRGASPASSAASSTASSQQPPAAAPPPMASVPGKLTKEEVLKKAYQDVQHGKIKDPQTIRNIATRFDAVAQDTEASQNFSFDAARAARNLRKRADDYEDLMETPAPAGYDDITQVDGMMPPQANDDNRWGGG